VTDEGPRTDADLRERVEAAADHFDAHLGHVANGQNPYRDLLDPDASGVVAAPEPATVREAHATMTNDERRAYQSLRDRGYSHDDALGDALDGVHVDDVRADRIATDTTGAGQDES